jgi:hypothetical protein
MTVGCASLFEQLSSRNPRGNDRNHMCMRDWRSSNIPGKVYRFVNPAMPLHAWKQILFVLAISLKSLLTRKFGASLPARSTPSRLAGSSDLTAFAVTFVDIVLILYVSSRV